MLLLKVVGWSLAHSPEWLLRALSVSLGEVVGWLPRRRRTIRSNLHHAFPQRPDAWHAAMVRESGRRLIETGLWSLASPYLSDARLQRCLRLSPAMEAALRHQHNAPQARLVLTPHLAYWEALTCLGLLTPVPLGEFGVIFRPLRKPAMNDFVQRTRERFGMRLLSRREGFQDALRILRFRGWIGLLFDQNTREQGALTLFLDRLASTTELGGLLRTKYSAEAGFVYARREAFWRVVIEYEPLDAEPGIEATTLAHNRWLEHKLSTDDNLAASWLWSHNRWRIQHEPARRFRLEQKRNLLDREREGQADGTLPRRTRFFIRLPETPAEVEALWPGLLALRQSRPDAEITLIGEPALAPASAPEVADHWRVPPDGALRRARWFHGLRRHYPDTWIDAGLTRASRVEAWLSRCPQRFGIHSRSGWLTHVWSPPPGGPVPTAPAFWRLFLEAFGLPSAATQA
jgi:heptosyltransferase II